MIPKLTNVTLVCVDTTDRVDLGIRALYKSSCQCGFGKIMLFTDRKTVFDPRGTVLIPKLNGIEEYSRFVVRKLHQHIKTTHALIVQADGYVLNGAAWSPDFLKCDYIGAPWEQWKTVGNGGFSLRSKRFMAAASQLGPNEYPHPEDTWLCHTHRETLKAMGMVYAPIEVARRFAFEGRCYNGKEWAGVPLAYNKQFGFHSWLTPLQSVGDRPMIFHHSGDLGDVIYSLPVIRMLGGGVLFVSVDNKFAYPAPTKFQRAGMESGPAFAGSLRPLLMHQDYVWAVQSAPARPFSTDVDLNSFRRAYQSGGPANWENIFKLHQLAFNIHWPEDEPWLECRDPLELAGRDIIVNRTQRYRNDKFPWAYFMREYGHRMAFIGYPDEYQLWRGLYPDAQIPHFPAENLWECARVIAGARVFIGNQSCCLAIAHGLGKRVVVEVWKANPNCCLKRKEALYCADAIPKEWLQ